VHPVLQQQQKQQTDRQQETNSGTHASCQHGGFLEVIKQKFNAWQPQPAWQQCPATVLRYGL
jgi:hypothetical protein